MQPTGKRAIERPKTLLLLLLVHAYREHYVLSSRWLGHWFVKKILVGARFLDSRNPKSIQGSNISRTISARRGIHRACRVSPSGVQKTIFSKISQRLQAGVGLQSRIVAFEQTLIQILHTIT
jgi:hypothetical protein